MRNRAKCKLCGDILESFHEFDYQTCKCNEISISGGLIRYECAAKDFSNFLRVDDEGNEIVPTIKHQNIITEIVGQNEINRIKDNTISDLVDLGQKIVNNLISPTATKKNHIDSLDSQIKIFKRIFDLHPDMQYQYVSQSDFVSALELILDCLRSG